MNKVIYLLILSIGIQVSAEVPALMKNLINLRADLETLNREMESIQKERQSELDLWVQKKLELEATLQKENLRRIQLSEKTMRLALRVKNETKSNPESKRELVKWIQQTKNWINSSLPYRRDHRLQSVQILEDRAEKGLESLESLSAELWMFVESEMKLASDNEFRLVDIESSNGAAEKNEVVRLGLFTMYLRNADGKMQQYLFSDGKWDTKPVSDSAIPDVTRLFSNMKAKKDSGLYSLSLPSIKETL